MISFMLYQNCAAPSNFDRKPS